MPPVITVAMPCYNAEKYIPQAIESILCQDYPHFELLIINDGSTDNSLQAIRSFQDNRIRLISLEKNIGLADVRNKCLQEAKGDFIAWLDADDWSEPTRLSQQMEYLEKNTRVVACGTDVIIHNELNIKKLYKKDFFLPKETTASIFFLNPLATSSVMMRSSIAEPFDPKFAPTEDYDIWERFVSKGYYIANLPFPHTHYRKHENQSSQITEKKTYQKKIDQILLRPLSHLNMNPSLEEEGMHLLFIKNQLPNNLYTLKKMRRWIIRLAQQNDKKGIYPKKAFKKLLLRFWEFPFQKYCLNNPAIWFTYLPLLTAKPFFHWKKTPRILKKYYFALRLSLNPFRNS